MPGGSRFQTFRAQSIALGVLMLLFFASSMAVAYGLVSGRESPHPVVERVAITVGDLRFFLPGSWAVSEGADLHPELEALAYIDTARPSRRLAVVRVEVDPPVRGTAVLNRIVPAIVGPQETPQIASAALARLPHADPRVTIVEWIGVNEADDGTRLHFSADITADGRVHWVFYLTDRIQPGEDGRMPGMEGRALLRHLHQTAILASPSAE